MSLLTSCGFDAPVDRPPGPNVLVISFDALRADALGTFGSPRRTSPAMDAFAVDSLVFERAYSAASITPASFAASWTGKLPHRVFQRWQFVPDETIGDHFAAAGYRTAAFVNNVNLTEERDFGEGFDDYELYRLVPDSRLLEEAGGWLEEHGGEPFFLWVHFNAPHAPYELRESSAHLYDPDYRGRFQRTSGVRFETHDPAEIRRLRQLYEGEVYFADSLFRRLLERLDGLGLADDTVVALTSDHGEEFHEHRKFQHTTLHAEALHVPLLIRRPGSERGVRHPEPVSLVDLMPTLLEAAGLPVPPGIDGVSLLGTVPEGRPVISESLNPGKFLAVSAVVGDEQIIRHCVPQRNFQFFDLGRTPSREVKIGPPAAQRRLRDLRRLLLDRFGASPCNRLMAAAIGGDETDGLSRESMEALRSLGYLD